VRGQAETRTASGSFGPGLGLGSPAPRKEMPSVPTSCRRVVGLRHSEFGQRLAAKPGDGFMRLKVGCRDRSLRQIRPLRHTIKQSLFIGQAVNHRLSTTACQPPLKCQPVYWLTETSSRQTPSSATQSSLCGFSARIDGIARACGLICLMRATGENPFPASRAPDAAKVSVGK
jgi:hypothetical protein